MTADRWTQAVRHQLGLGRLLPLGGPRDGAWITERAADAVLRAAALEVPGVRLGRLRLALADPPVPHDAAVPPPPSALPPGPLRITAEFAVSADPAAPGTEPLPTTASRLRAALHAASARRLGLVVAEVDLRVTGLLDRTDGSAAATAPAGEAATASTADASGTAGAAWAGEREARPDGWRPDEPRAGSAGEPAGEGPRVGPAQERPSARGTAPSDDESRAAAAARSVPGVVRLGGTSGGLGRTVHIEERPGDTALARRHVRVEIEAHADERAVDVARAVRGAVADALTGHPSVAVLVTAVSR
ncbi:nucleopolyhedrovirus P10 family protein [Streptomyces fructofermentans]|uniref:nucleopolyhedrovirus P10 family protein n=1 Tax=Streptomyces fructofermentans TaxID=152141 RepID=UPI0034099FAC